MNVNYIHALTVYNCLAAADNPDGRKEAWQKTVLHGCYYKNAVGRIEDGTSIRMSNLYTARVPESEKYLPYREWARLPAEERKGFFTFRLSDIVVKGECREEITGISPDTASEILRRCKPDAFTVTAFSDNTAHLCAKHYRLGG